MSVQVSLSLKQIYKALCPSCQEKIVSLVKERMASDAVKQALEGDDDTVGKDAPPPSPG